MYRGDIYIYIYVYTFVGSFHYQKIS